jgi:hypothetical protein
MLLALAALSTAQAAEPTGTLTLACQGETKEMEPQLGAKPEPISMGIILDFAARTVEGFGSDATFRIVIGNITETLIDFIGDNSADLTRLYEYRIFGTIDRVTGVVEATFY